MHIETSFYLNLKLVDTCTFYGMNSFTTASITATTKKDTNAIKGANLMFLA